MHVNLRWGAHSGRIIKRIVREQRNRGKSSQTSHFSRFEDVFDSPSKAFGWKNKERQLVSAPFHRGRFGPEREPSSGRSTARAGEWADSAHVEERARAFNLHTAQNAHGYHHHSSVVVVGGAIKLSIPMLTWWLDSTSRLTEQSNINHLRWEYRCF